MNLASRRVLPALIALGFALAFAGAAAKEPWETQWDKTLDAARKEGVVVVSGPPGDVQRNVITGAWTKAFPDIRLEYTGARGTQIVASVVRERASGIYNWDVILASADPTVYALDPINALAPFRSALIKPDLAAERTWIGSFSNGLLDDQKKYFFSPTGIVIRDVGMVNRDCVPESALNKAKDLMKPEFRGKISWYDPSQPGFGARGTWLLTQAIGKDSLKDLMLNHDVTYSRDYKQMTDWVISCTKPIAMMMSDDVINAAQQQGVGTHVVRLNGPAFAGKVSGWTGANESIGWYNNAPHPNAAKIFVNWYLSQPFQQAYALVDKTNSRRADTKPGDPNPNDLMKAGVTYLNLANESSGRDFKALQADIKQWGIGQ